MKIDIEGGPAQVLCDSGSFVFGGFWTPDGKIVFGDLMHPPGLWEVPATGGVPSPLPGIEHDGYPSSLLPDGRHFIYLDTGSESGSTYVYVGSLDKKSGQSSKKLVAAIGAGYVPSPDDPDLGYLLFVRPTAPGPAPIRTFAVMAQPFDPRKLELVGEPTAIAEQVSTAATSLTGTLVYGSGPLPADMVQLTLFDRQGKTLGTIGEPGVYRQVAFSPDERRVVAALLNHQSTGSNLSNLWIYDLARGVSSQFTFSSSNDRDGCPVWSSDGSRVAFCSTRGDHARFDLYQRLSNGGGDDEFLFKSDSDVIPQSWSDDGRFLLFGSEGATVSVLPLDANGHAAGKPFVFVEKGVGIDPRFSPGSHGRPLWVAYSSNESGRFEIYMRPFDPKSPTGIPPGGGKWQVSKEGGVSPRWNSDGKELFYVAPDGTVMSVEVSGGTVFEPQAPKPLFKPKGLFPRGSNESLSWDAGSDGKKFILAVSPSATGAAPLIRFVVVLNWPSLLKK
jgi:hypothetical protein